MDNWQPILAATGVGAIIGAAAGVIPLAFGFFHRQPRNAVAAFLGCVIGGAVGGIYPAIAGIGIGLGVILRRKKNSENGSRRSE